MKTKITTLVIVLFCSVAPLQRVAADTSEGPGRYQIFQQSDGLYAFDTHIGEVFFLRLVNGNTDFDPSKLVWIKLSAPISEAIAPDQVRR